MTPALRRFAHWTATLAVLLAALMPALMQAGATERNATLLLSDICSHAGVQIAAADHGVPLPATEKSAKPCPWCKLHASVAIAPSGGEFIHAAPVIALRTALPDPPHLPAATAARPAAPRGPPVLS